MQPEHHRYRVTVIAHRRSTSFPAAWSDSGIVRVQTVRATTPALARDLALVHVHAESALVADVRVGVDAVLVERLRWGRSPVRELDSRRTAVVR
ncbi:hypothetical protein [Kineococcus rhizosphaerae]|uniref:Uncharacterized protein n=1 Tax=Kineococcus rhizosphaerae TaxID=559628 RepID=A0A2T0R6J8_9ACTN|nr:hypothetical protein [Kineococcus rhizosphaerae]PRY16795.1 hypothetical protein CLV37_103226 [Kineococcus rhizosphaerae]